VTTTSATVNVFEGRTMLVTGGTGSFGQRFTRALLSQWDPAAVRIFSRDELKQSEMARRIDDERLRFLLGDIRDRDRLRRAVEGVDIVVHAAALKQVPACEYNPFEAVRTNILGAQNVAEASLDIAAAIAAIAVAWTVLVLRGGSLEGLRARLRLPPGFDVAAVAVGVVALIALAVGARADFATYQTAIGVRATATPADVAVLGSLSARLPRGALVLTDGLTDAGVWVRSLSDLIPLVPNSQEDGALSLRLVGALHHACENPAAAERALQKVAAVFVGSHHLAGFPNEWDPQCIARLPDVRQIAAVPWQGTEAAAFAVIH
jgi:NAD(P)-dependent dehydrogenase (short-subunit alcohol dehydrogenase family)